MKVVLWIATTLIAIFVVLTWIFHGYCIVEKNNILIVTHSSNLCLTSTPDRLVEPWIQTNILDMQRLQGHLGVILSIPWVFAKTGEPYILPDALGEAEGLRILRCDDEGPGTKVLAPLKEASIPEDRILMFCDDDVRYKPHTFLHLLRAICEEPSAVHTVCQGKVTGYLGFGGYKRTMLPILQISRPLACQTVDDDFFTSALKSLGIPIRKTYIPGCMSFCQACAYDMPTSMKRLIQDRDSLFYTEVLTTNKRSDSITKCIDALRENSV